MKCEFSPKFRRQRYWSLVSHCRLSSTTNRKYSKNEKSFATTCRLRLGLRWWQWPRWNTFISFGSIPPAAARVALATTTYAQEIKILHNYPPMMLPISNESWWAEYFAYCRFLETEHHWKERRIDIGRQIFHQSRNPPQVRNVMEVIWIIMAQLSYVYRTRW